MGVLMRSHQKRDVRFSALRKKKPTGLLIVSLSVFFILFFADLLLSHTGMTMFAYMKIVAADNGHFSTYISSMTRWPVLYGVGFFGISNMLGYEIGNRDLGVGGGSSFGPYLFLDFMVLLGKFHTIRYPGWKLQTTQSIHFIIVQFSVTRQKSKLRNNDSRRWKSVIPYGMASDYGKCLFVRKSSHRHNAVFLFYITSFSMSLTVDFGVMFSMPDSWLEDSGFKSHKIFNTTLFFIV